MWEKITIMFSIRMILIKKAFIFLIIMFYNNYIYLICILRQTIYYAQAKTILAFLKWACAFHVKALFGHRKKNGKILYAYHLDILQQCFDSDTLRVHCMIKLFFFVFLFFYFFFFGFAIFIIMRGGIFFFFFEII